MAEHLIFDGHNLAVRCAHAIEAAGLTNADGVPTGEAFAFLKALGGFKTRFPLAKVTVVWDGSSHKRKAVFDGYKASRGMLRKTFPVEYLKGLLPFLSVRQAMSPTDEADDVIGVLVRVRSSAERDRERSPSASWEREREREEDRFTIVTTDCDLLQTVTPKVRVLMPPAGAAKDRRETLYGEIEVLAEYGVPVGQLLDLRALAGDVSDEIPGVPELGPKRAAKLLTFHGSLDAVFEEALRDKARKRKGILASPMTDLQRKNLREHEGIVRRNLAIMRLSDVDEITYTEGAFKALQAAVLLQKLDIKVDPILDLFFPKQTAFA
jgi:DNA polymerase-1